LLSTAAPPHTRQVFLNCPFDNAYRSLLEAIVFSIYDCGFRPRCALQVDDGGQVRMEKLFGMIADCNFGIHDISRTELDALSQLPRFNMPLELGLFLGAKRFGTGRQREKICLILDRESYRFQKFISDIGGQDIQAHGDDPKKLVALVRNWLRSAKPQVTTPGGEAIWKRYQAFRTELPSNCRRLKLVRSKLTFIDYTWLVSEWIQNHRYTTSIEPSF
jgi:hypothetical protein